MTPPAISPTSIDVGDIELLAEHHDVISFKCREKALAYYLRKHAILSTELGYGRTYVVVQPGHPRVWAYYTVSSAMVDATKFPGITTKPPPVIPAILLGRMAKDNQLSVKDMTPFLMAHLFKVSLEVSRLIGIYCIIVDAKNDFVKHKIYAPYGFLPLLDDPLRLFLPIMTVYRDLQEMRQSQSSTA